MPGPRARCSSITPATPCNRAATIIWVPADAEIRAEADIVFQAFRLNDFLEELARIPAAARVVVIDAAHDLGLARDAAVPAGLAINPVTVGMAVGFAAAPGALVIETDGQYGVYAASLVTQMRQPGLEIGDIFTNTRVAVNQATQGAQTPWFVDQIEGGLFLFPPQPAAAPGPEAQPVPVPAPAPPPRRTAASRDALQAMGPDDAYLTVVALDRLEPYQWFVELFPDHPSTPQIWEIIETRREQILWRRTLAQNTRNAYWNYLKRYPDGAHAAEAEGRLEALSAPRRPPPTYVVEPEPLPPEWTDEAVGIAEVVPLGVEPPPPVWGLFTPFFIRRPPPPPWWYDRRPPGFRPPPPPPPPPWGFGGPGFGPGQD